MAAALLRARSPRLRGGRLRAALETREALEGPDVGRRRGRDELCKSLSAEREALEGEALEALDQGDEVSAPGSVAIGRGLEVRDVAPVDVDAEQLRREVEQLAADIDAGGWCAASWCATCGATATLHCIYGRHSFAGCR